MKHTKRQLGALLVQAMACVALVGALAPGSASAAELRYGLVVGANHGDTGTERTLPDLHHAERDAARVHAILARRANFSPDRLLLLQAPTRAEVFDAIDRIRARVAQDRADYPDLDVLFLVYFSGHGVAHSLLVSDGPISAAELAAALDTVDSKLSLRFIDACESGSLVDDALSAKGMEPVGAADFDLVAGLPPATINAEGALWILSAQAGQRAYEHGELGGLFTHAFLEAFDRLEPADHGIRFSQVWDYVSGRTASLAAQNDKLQTPRLSTREFNQDGPVYLAWNQDFGAVLVVDADVDGPLKVTYRDNRVLDLAKPAGKRSELLIFPGVIDVVAKGAGGAERVLLRDFPVAFGTRVHLTQRPSLTPSRPFGRSMVQPKGGTAVAARGFTEVEATTAYVGLNYRFSATPTVVLGPSSVLSLSGRLELGRWLVRAEVGYGFDRRSYPRLSYDAHALVVALQGGYGVDLGPLRLTPMVSAGGGLIVQEFEGDDARTEDFLELLGGVVLGVPVSDGAAVEVVTGGGARNSLGAGVGSPRQWSALWHVGVGVALRL